MRYLPLNDSDRSAMLGAIGVDSIDDLFCDVPQAARLDGPVDLPAHQSEMAVERIMRGFANKNMDAGSVPFFLGGGAYRHHVPASVDYMIQRGEFLTAYTPYQPEISQGTLQYLFEFQTQVAQLLGMDVANASLYDGSTACGEAVLMARRITRRKRALLAGGLHAHYGAVVDTMTKFTDDEVVRLNPQAAAPDADIAALIDQIDENVGCVVVQSPDMFGNLIDLTPIAEAVHARGALLIAVVTEVVSLGAIKSPGEMGADIVVAEGQSIGGGLNFGGPYLGLFATNQKYVRQMPGRLCGETVDADGRRGFVLTLSTREQHIRREKATSNICTNSGLMALAFTVHMSLLGEKGLRKLAELNHAKAVQLADQLTALDGVNVLNQTFFNEFTIQIKGDGTALVEKLAAQNILAGIPAARLYPGDPDMTDKIIIAVTETVSTDDQTALISALKEALS